MATSSSELRRRKKVEDIRSDESEEEIEEKEKPVTLSPLEASLERKRKFRTRIVWGLLMMFVFAVILYMGHAVAGLFVMLVQIMVFKELTAIRYIEAKERKLPGFRTLNWYFLLGTFFWVYGPDLMESSSSLLRGLKINLDYIRRSHLMISFVLYVIGFVIFVFTLRKGSLKYQFGQLTWTLMTLMLVVGQSHFIIQNIFHGLFWFLFPSSLIICNDCMAYFCGLLAGRKFIDRPLTSLSPNKTWEGFVGALFSTLVFAFFASYLLAQIQYFICPKDLNFEIQFFVPLTCMPDPVFLPKTYQLPGLMVTALEAVGIHRVTVDLLPIQFHALVFALFASLVAPFGGFFASGVKRAYRVKDFDSLFPGHGGVTDRMDCQLIMGAFTYVYYTAFIKPLEADVPLILAMIAQLPLSDQRLVFDSLQEILSK